MKRKKFDPLDAVLDVGAVSAGTMFVGSLPGMLSNSGIGPSNTANKLIESPGRILPLIPVTSSLNAVYGSFNGLLDIERRLKKK